MTNHERGSAAVILLGVIVALIVILGMSYVSAYNTANQLENKLKAEQTNNENILAQYSQKVLEAAEVTTMMRDDIAKITKDALSGRYGKDGAKAIFQAITEQNPQLDSKIYVKLQQIVEAGRDEFKNGQTRMIDTKRTYETALGSFWQGMWMRMAGYPKIDLSKFVIVSNDHAQEAFKTGKETGPIQLRPAQ